MAVGVVTGAESKPVKVGWDSAVNSVGSKQSANKAKGINRYKAHGAYVTNYTF